MDYLPLFLLLGAFAGIMAGLLGIGGGLLIVPVLAWLFAKQGVEASIIMQMAVGTSLMTIIFTSISSVIAHHKRGAVLWSVFFQLLPGIIIGAIAGAAMADILPSKQLGLMFGLFELWVAIQMALALKPKPQRSLPNRLGMNVAGSIIGSFSSILGIGGGTMTVPFLTWCNVNIQKAIATSSACGLPIAIAGTIGFMIVGANHPNLPAYSTGYVNWSAALSIIVSSVMFAPVGAWLAHRLSTKHLKRVFSGLLFVLAVKMLLMV